MYNIGRILAAIIGRVCYKLSDDIYLRIRYYLIMGYKLNLNTPVAFNEKINWLKVYNKNPLYQKLVDKSTVKDYVKERIGEQYIIPTYGVWDKFDDIDFNALPSKFVLKSTNGGGGNGVVVCRDKNVFDKKNARKQLQKSMSFNWKIGREWVYKDIKPRFIAEQIIENNDGSDLVDYKFHCFNGEPKLLFYASDRYKGKNSLKFDWYDMNLNHLPIKSEGYDNSNAVVEKFLEFDEMIKIAKKLSNGIPYVRVDLYFVNGVIYFGEMTFFHDAGFVALKPFEWEIEIGSWIKLN